jgi:cobalt-zinc-cadmium efflux system outer membrane protein
VKSNKANIEFLGTVRGAAQKQVDVGTAPESQLIKTDVELAKAKQELAGAERELAKSKSALNVLLNRPAQTDLEVASPLALPDLSVDLERVRKSAPAQRPEVAAARSRLAAERQAIRAARLRRAPDLAFQARKDTLDGDGGFAIAVTLPLIDWGSIRAEERRAELTARALEKQLEAVENGVTLDVEQAAIDVEASTKIVSEYRGGVLEKSEQLAAMAQKGYEKGATGYLEVIEAQRTLQTVRTGYAAALVDRAKALARLEWAAGYREEKR